MESVPRLKLQDFAYIFAPDHVGDKDIERQTDKQVKLHWQTTEQRTSLIFRMLLKILAGPSFESTSWSLHHLSDNKSWM